MPNQFEDAIAQAQGTLEPQRQHTWIFRVDGLPGADVLELALRVGFIPSESSDEIEIPYMNSKVYVAGKATYETGSITYNDYIDVNVAGIIAAWRKMVWNPDTGGVGLAANYKKNGQVVMFAPDFSVARIWLLRGIWPQAVNYGTLDYGSSDVVQIECTFRYDKAIPQFSI